MQRPLQASDPPQTSSQSGEQLSANDSSVTCLHGEESEPPGTGLSALVPNLCYSDDDVSALLNCSHKHVQLVAKLPVCGS